MGLYLIFYIRVRMKAQFQILLISILFINFLACKKSNNRLPLLTTSVYSTGVNYASCSGVLYSEGDAKVTEKGILWLKEGAAGEGNKVVCETSGQTFTGFINGLEPETQYKARAYATNKFGTSYGKWISFKTLTAYFPSLHLSQYSSPGTNSTDFIFDIDQRMPAEYITGICWSESPTPTILSNTVAVNERKISEQVPYNASIPVTLKNLDAETRYYARAFSTSTLGTVYSNQATWVTSAVINPLSFSLRSLAHTNADFNLTISNIDPASVQGVGICWSNNPAPTVSNNVKERAYVSSSIITIDPLNTNTTYFVRAYIKTNGQIIYSATEQNIRTLKSTVTDVNGNIYNTVEIGGVEWMVSNYKASSFSNGITIPQIKPNANYNQWVNNVNAQTPVYCYYGDNSSYNSTLGKLYPKYVAQNPNFPPTGWRLPTAAEWEALVASTKGIEELCIVNGSWQSPTITNAYGFSLYAAGYWDSGFGGMGSESRFWVAATTTSIYENNTYLFSSYKSAKVWWYQSGDAQSVRFVKQ